MKLISALLIVGLLGGGAYYVYAETDIFSDDSEDGVAQEEKENIDSAEEQNPSGPETAASTDEVGLEITLEGLSFTLNGTVSDQTARDTLVATTEGTYGQYATIDLKVNPNAEPQNWEQCAPQLVKNFSPLVSGKLNISGNSAELTGKAPQDDYRALFNSYLEECQFSELDDTITAINQDAPNINFKVDSGQVTVSGELATQEVVDIILTDLATIYGEENITSELVASDEVFSRLQLARSVVLVSVMKPFGDHEVNLENDVLSIIIQDGVAFESGSAVLTEETKELVANLAIIVDRSIHPINVIGHTDNTGPEEANQELSVQRAQAFADALIESGNLDFTENIRVVGKGESEPIATNDTEAGKAQNRRVELRVEAD